MTRTGNGNLRPFKPGQSGNPAGRKPGSRNKLGEAFLEALLEDWTQHGAVAIVKVREEKPDQYLKVVASVIPREVELTTREPRLHDMSDEQLLAIVHAGNRGLIDEGSDNAA